MDKISPKILLFCSQCPYLSFCISCVYIFILVFGLNFLSDLVNLAYLILRFVIWTPSLFLWLESFSRENRQSHSLNCRSIITFIRICTWAARPIRILYLNRVYKLNNIGNMKISVCYFFCTEGKRILSSGITIPVYNIIFVITYEQILIVECSVVVAKTTVKRLIRKISLVGTVGLGCRFEIKRSNRGSLCYFHKTVERTREN